MKMSGTKPMKNTMRKSPLKKVAISKTDLAVAGANAVKGKVERATQALAKGVRDRAAKKAVADKITKSAEPKVAVPTKTAPKPMPIKATAKKDTEGTTKFASKPMAPVGAKVAPIMQLKKMGMNKGKKC